MDVACERITHIAQTLMVPSPPVLASQPTQSVEASPRPQDTLYTLRLCPRRTWTHCQSLCKPFPLSHDQSRTVRSSEAEASKSPEGENATDQTVEVCPFRVAKSYQSSDGSSIYNLIRSSYELDARICPISDLDDDGANCL